MIDITVDEIDETVEIEGKQVFSIGENHSLAALIEEVIDKAKYSGESISLWRVDGKYKRLVKQW